MDTEVFLGCACELLAIPSTSERPAERPGLPGDGTPGLPRHPQRPPGRRPGSAGPVPPAPRRRPPVRPRRPGHEGGRDGTRHQLDHGVRGRFVIVGETSGLRIVNESKGMLVVRLLAAGRAAHAAYPWLGDNALVKLQRTVASLLARYPIATEEVWRTTVN